MVIGAQKNFDVLMAFELRWKSGKVYTKVV
jgi:hypothetical protein